jgi:acyl carrier protein
MGWRSYFSGNSGGDGGAARRDAEHRGARPADRAAAPPPHPEIVHALKAHLIAVYRSRGETVDEAEFDPHLDLREAGYLDSLSTSEFLLLAEQQYAIALPDWLIGGQANTLAALAAYIEAELARRAS